MIPLQDSLLAAGLLFAAVALGWAAVSDLRRYLIPNRACAAVALGCVVASPALPPAAWMGGLAAGGSVLVLGALLFARGWVGGGDVKLAAASSLWAGPAFLSDFAFVTSASGVVLAAVMLSPLRRLMPQAPGGGARPDLRQPMPFGVPLAVGGGWVLVLHLTSSL